MPSTSPLRVLTLTTLPLLSFLGFYNTFFTARLNGTGTIISSFLNSGTSARFPGTEAPLLRTYTHIRSLDETFTLLVIFFAPVCDGSLDGYSRWALGQFGAAWSVMVMEGLRVGSKGRIVSWTGAFGLALQFLSFTVVTPIFLLIHLLTSPIPSATPPELSLLVQPRDLKLLPYTIGIGYILPSLAMGISPPSVSQLTHQRLIAFWQFFPLFTTLTHSFLTKLQPLIFPTAHTAIKIQGDSPMTSIAKSEYLTKSKTIQTILLILCTSTHLSSITSALVKGTIQQRFVPFSLLHGPNTSVPNLATGVKNFLQWDIYIGCSSLLLWTAFLYHQAKKTGKPNSGGLKWSLAIMAVVAGPMGIVVWLLGERDRLVLEGGEERKEIKRA